MEKIRLGIIGFGNMGTGHYNNIKNGLCPEIEVAAIADIDPDRIKWAEENLPDSIKKLASAEEMLDSGLIDAALVAVPHYDHPGTQKSALSDISMLWWKSLREFTRSR